MFTVARAPLQGTSQPVRSRFSPATRRGQDCPRATCWGARGWAVGGASSAARPFPLAVSQDVSRLFRQPGLFLKDFFPDRSQAPVLSVTASVTGVVPLQQTILDNTISSCYFTGWCGEGVRGSFPWSQLHPLIKPTSPLRPQHRDTSTHTRISANLQIALRNTSAIVQQSSEIQLNFETIVRGRVGGGFLSKNNFKSF